MATKPIQTPLSADLPTDWTMNQIVSPNGTEVGLSEQHGYNYLSAAVNAAQTAVNTINDAFVNLSDQQDLSEVMSGANTYFVSAVTEVDGAENQYDFTVSDYTAGEPAMLIFKAPIPAGGSFLFTVNGEHPGEDPAKWYQAAFSDLTTDVIGLWAGGAYVPLIISDVVGENGNTLAFVPAGGVRATLIPPAQSGTLTYNGSVQSPAWSGYDSTKMTMGGVTSGTNAGSYTATFTPKSNYAWTDGTTSAKEVTWTIGRAGVVLPAQSGSLTFNGQPQSPTWTTYDPDAMTMGGTTSATNAGNYSAIFTPNSNYAWMDGTFTEKSVLWTIGKAAGSLSLNIESLSLNYLNPTGTVAVTRAGGGAISAVSNAPGVASAAVSGTNVVVTALATGSAIVTVSVAETVNYTAPVPKTIQVTAQMVDPVLENNTWAKIAEVSASGKAGSVWQVGSEKNIVIGATGEMVTLVILGFNHDDLATGGKAGITFGMKNLMADARQINSENTSEGGYAGSEIYKWLQNTVLPSLPADLQNVLKTVNKRTGNGDPNSPAIVVNSMKLFLFAMEEVIGYASENSLAGEGTLYSYFATAETRIKYMYNGAGAVNFWWVRSPNKLGQTGRWCRIATNGAPSIRTADDYQGVCFGFCV